KAIATQADMDVYEAIRTLSIVKECPDSTDADIALAEENLRQASAANTDLSEASLLTRLHWWTVEYGLVGDLANYRIFGAGLLSSLGESRHCLDDALVRKRPLTVDAVRYPYDITTVQPQLFVTSSCRHLSQVLEEFAAGMCFQRGGAESLQVAVKAGSMCTAQYDSGMQVSGVFDEVLCDAVGNAVYLRTRGPTQLAWGHREIYGHGVAHHGEGFGSPIGHLKDFSRGLCHYSIDELKAHDIVIGKPARLEFLSGITVSGQLLEIVRQEHRNLILSFDNCTVTDLEGRVLFDPHWGRYDMAVGARITSVFGGVADREALQLHKPPPSTRAIPVTQDARLMSLYALAEELRRSGRPIKADTLQELERGLESYPDEWLFRVELLSVDEAALQARLTTELKALACRRADLAALIEMSLDPA
ncbi:MAG: aromatic amino acid hydroxylase, partial [Anaerolineae bacterium]|nr:aromatic amino acid hydroxylase [Anaerolineae bacterium]